MQYFCYFKDINYNYCLFKSFLQLLWLFQECYFLFLSLNLCLSRFGVFQCKVILEIYPFSQKEGLKYLKVPCVHVCTCVHPGWLSGEFLLWETLKYLYLEFFSLTIFQLPREGPPYNCCSWLIIAGPMQNENVGLLAQIQEKFS